MHNGKEYADKSLKEALLAFSQGKKVLVLTEYDDGSMNIDNMEKYFTENTTFFVEVPAVENPEFAKALAEMGEKRKRGDCKSTGGYGRNRKEAEASTGAERSSGR